MVYVDRDPIVSAHAHQLLRGTPEGATTYMYGDQCEPAVILRAADRLAGDVETEALAETFRRLNDTMAESVLLRGRDEVAGLFGELELVEPGVVQFPQSRPEAGITSAGPLPMWCGVARKTG